MAALKLQPIGFRRSSAIALTGVSVIIVEDEPLIALDLHAALSATGASIIAATNGAEAYELIRSADISVAVLDVNLGDRDCSSVCQALHRRKILFLYTGHAHVDLLADWPQAPVVGKPAPPSVIVEHIAALVI
jgi:DNA-binding response OmpR family regulator